MTTNQFTSVHGDRPEFPNVAIVIMATHADQGQNDTVSAALAAWNAGITVYSIGVTSNIDQTEIQSISNSPHQLNISYFVLADPSYLSTISTSLFNVIFSGTVV